MAGANFDADMFGDPDDIGDLGEFDSFESLMDAFNANLPGNKDKARNARLILERYIRDFEKSTQKKIQEVTSKLNQVENRGAPRANSQEDLQRQVDALIERQQANFEKLGIQVEKEFDNINTRLKTQKGLAEDFSEIQRVRASMDEALGLVDDSLKRAKEGLMDRGTMDMDRRQSRSRIIAARKEAQRIGEKAQDEFLEANRQELQPTFREKAFGLADRLLLMGRRGTISDDKREERRRDVVERAQAAGDEAAQRSFRRFLDQDEEAAKNVRSGKMPGFDFKAPGAKAGFRAQDLGSMFSKAAGAANAAMIISDRAQQAISAPFENLQGALLGQKSGAAFTTSALTGGSQLGPLSKFADTVVGTLQKIADNTAQEIMPFSPELIAANVDNQLRVLEANIRRGQEMGNILATMARSQTDFELATKELGDRLIEEFGPMLTVLTSIGVDSIKAISASIDALPAAIQVGLRVTGNAPMADILNALSKKIGVEYDKILKKHKEEGMVDIGQDLDAFFANRGNEFQVNNNIPAKIKVGPF